MPDEDYRDKVVSLWVVRRRRELEREWATQIWHCRCGSRFFEIVRYKGPVCERCGLPADPPRER